MTHDPEHHDHHSAPKKAAGTVLLHWSIFLVVMTALIGGAALIF